MDSSIEIDEKIALDVYTQDYSPKSVIEGVVVKSLKVNVDEEGDFSEIVRINQEGYLEMFPEFKLSQINRTKLNPGSIKAWHLHMEQDEIWYLISGGHLFVGLWDTRKNSKTSGQSMRIALGDGGSSIVFIPKGVAHGSANFTTEPVQLIYFVNKQFNIQNPDEKRIRWDALTAHFWETQKD